MIPEFIGKTYFYLSQGAFPTEGGIYFSFVSAREKCGVLIYDKKTEDLIDRFYFDKSDTIGNLNRMFLKGFKPEKIMYLFFEDDTLICDRESGKYYDSFEYGVVRDESDMKAVFDTSEFDWGNDIHPQTPIQDSFIYSLHVRGFTKHSSSKVKRKGTFLGIAEKCDYLKELGVTAIELQPAYEFFEYQTKAERMNELHFPVTQKELDRLAPLKLNYWGYKPGFYYSPKASYSYKDSVEEFKIMVKTLHSAGIEVIMQFYFKPDIDAKTVRNIFRFWTVNYHVDGFHIIGEAPLKSDYYNDPALCNCKFISQNEVFDSKYGNVILYQGDFKNNSRKLLKGDEDQIGAFMYNLRNNRHGLGNINYIADCFGFSLKDIVSYDWKHNEDNGEDNTDGEDYNASWNCGFEGPTRKLKINALRLKQLKNAFCMLMFSQGTPLIFMGDEFGNSQKGNNNPYCQDNEITWLNWNDLKKNKVLFDFVKELSLFRKDNKILHFDKDPRMMDHLSCGLPDMSYHGCKPWKVDNNVNSRTLAVMFCGDYDEKKDSKHIYVAFNFHWENHVFDLPNLPDKDKGEWEFYLSTADKPDISQNGGYIIEGRSVAVFVHSCRKRKIDRNKTFF